VEVSWTAGPDTPWSGGRATYSEGPVQYSGPIDRAASPAIPTRCRMPPELPLIDNRGGLLGGARRRGARARRCELAPQPVSSVSPCPSSASTTSPCTTKLPGRGLRSCSCMASRAASGAGIHRYARGRARAVSSPMKVHRFMADCIQGSEHIVVRDSGHLTNLEAPAAFDEAVNRFLARS
jgi:hypothetical protein